jgi:hypothetical protein
VRGYAIELMGRMLMNTQSEITEEIIERSTRLWEERLTAAQRAPNSWHHEQEMISFEWWLISGKFDNAWALAQWKAALSLFGVTPVRWTVKDYATRSRIVHLLSYAAGDK